MFDLSLVWPLPCNFKSHFCPRWSTGTTLFGLIWDDPTQATSGANFAALTSYITIVIIMPFCFLKDMNLLGFTSMLSLLPLVYMYGFQVWKYPKYSISPAKFCRKMLGSLTLSYLRIFASFVILLETWSFDIRQFLTLIPDLLCVCQRRGIIRLFSWKRRQHWVF